MENGNPLNEKALFQAQGAIGQQNGEKRGKWPFFAQIVVISQCKIKYWSRISENMSNERIFSLLEGKYSLLGSQEAFLTAKSKLGGLLSY